MKILLIGHSVIDTIDSSFGRQVKPGGIYYSAAGMYYIKDPSDEIYLLTALTEEGNEIFNNIYMCRYH